MKSILSESILFILLIQIACSSTPKKISTPTIGPKTVAVPLEDYGHIFYVSTATGSNENGAGSARQPWKTMSFALDQIRDASPKNRYALIVSRGEYAHTPIPMKPDVDIYGGFDPATWERDIEKNRTILTAEGERRVVIGADHACLDGFVISDGCIRGKGAGIVCDGVSPRLTNNIFISNKTLAPLHWNPKFLHKTANDGGAIYCENGASPIIENNIFSRNATENGRGAAIAFHNHCNGRIANNVFLDNTTGLNDPRRSSDGGAISIFDWSSPVIENNVILNNQSLAKNDAGGLFVALWSAPIIRKNIFVGNQCTDDAGALFVGGQEHRYDRPLDSLLGEDKFFVRIDSNVFIGNSNPSKNSGAMRFTMESRGQFSHNIVAHNSGIYFQRSEVTVEKNIILDDFLFIETKVGLKPSLIQNNVLWGNLFIETEAIVKDNYLKEPRDANFNALPALVNNWINLQAMAATYHPRQFVTTILLSNTEVRKNELANRVIQAGNKWGVIKANDSRTIEIWDDFSGSVNFTVLPTYQLK